jgi:hypothetical protein
MFMAVITLSVLDLAPIVEAATRKKAWRPIDPRQLEAMWSPAEKAGVQRMLAASVVGSPAERSVGQR